MVRLSMFGSRDLPHYEVSTNMMGISKCVCPMHPNFESPEVIVIRLIERDGFE